MRLRESPKSDVAFSRKGEAFLQKAIAVLRHRAIIDPNARCPVIDCDDPDEISVVFDSGIPGSGSAEEHWSGGHSMTIGVGEVKTASNALKVLISPAGSDAFRHEFQHIMDMERHKKTVHVSYDHAKVVSGTASKDEIRQYYNNPTEYNAYFHNIAEPLLRILRLAEENHIDDAKKSGEPIDSDFKRYYQQMVWNMSSTNASVAANMNPSYRKKMLKRLYVLHQAVIEIVGSTAKDQRSFVLKVMMQVRRLLKSIDYI